MPSSTAAVPHELRPKKDRACDSCRRRKTKCDGSSMSNNVCTNCIQSRKPCTYVEASKPRGPPKAYVTGLEDRLQALEALLQQIRPGQDFSAELGPPVIRGSWKSQDGSADVSSSTRRKSVIPNNILPPLLVPYRSKKDEPSHTSDIFHSPRSTHLTFRSKPPSRRMHVDLDATLSSYSEDSSDETSSSSEQAEETVISSLAGREKITLLVSENDNSTEDDNIRFHGRSSTAGLIEITRQFKHMHMKDTISPPQREKQEKPTSPFPPNLTVAQWRRPTFWRRPKWEYSYESHRVESLDKLQSLLEYFPPSDLADDLINLYFRHSNLVLPLLHRPTFNRQWNQQLYRRNIWFAGVCLSIFAIACRWSDDIRVLPELIPQEGTEIDWRYAGRQYFDMVSEIHRIRESLLHPTSLFEVQTFTLMGIYLRSTATFPSAWIIISTGLRKTQDLGAHRKKVYREEANLDDELWKRAFWMLVILDRLGGVSLGRACSISEEDFDLDLPLEVDDEYYDQDSKQFNQPTGVPSTLTAFVQLIKLTQIMAFTMKTLYAINKSNIYHGVAPVDQKLITKQLSRAMSEWLECLPEHLRWREEMDNAIFFDQSAILFTLYHLTQMLVWRPLIGTSISPLHQAESTSSQATDAMPPIPALTDPSVIKCVEGARACARIVEVQLRHGINSFYIPGIINASYVCAGIFLLNAWHLNVQEKELRQRGTSDIKPPVSNHIEQDILEVKILMRALEEVKDRWDIVDVLLEELNESLIGLDGPELEYDTSMPHELQKSRSTVCVRNPESDPQVQYAPSEQHGQATGNTFASKDSHHSTSTTPLQHDRPAATLKTFLDSDPTLADTSHAIPIVPLDDRPIPSASTRTSWHEQHIPYISSIRRTPLSRNTTSVALQDEQFVTEELKGTASNKQPHQLHDVLVRTNNTQVSSDGGMYLSTPQFLQDGYHQNSTFVPSQISYERGRSRMDGWTNTPAHNASFERPVPGEDGWQTPSSGPAHPRALDPSHNRDVDR